MMTLPIIQEVHQQIILKVSFLGGFTFYITRLF